MAYRKRSSAFGLFMLYILCLLLDVSLGETVRVYAVAYGFRVSDQSNPYSSEKAGNKIYVCKVSKSVLFKL